MNIAETTDTEPQAQKAKVKAPRRSTLKLIFGYEPCFVLQDFNGNIFYQEFDSLFESQKNTKHRVHFFKEVIDKIQTNQFWKSFTKRIWQLDDFNFKGAAAVCFLGNAHRYKMLLNPYEMYKLCIIAQIYKNAPKRKTDESKEDYSKRSKEWSQENIVKFEETGVIDKAKKDEMDGRGLHQDLLLELKSCNTKKEWTEDGWKQWCDLIFSNEYFRNYVICVLMHEMMHVLWDHLTRVGDKNPMVWNYACDFAINSQLNWSEELRRVLITEDSDGFWDTFIYSIMKWQIINNKEVRDEIKEEYKLSSSSSFDDIIKHKEELYNKYMVEDTGVYGIFTRKKNKFSNQSAEFYYKVFMESNTDFDKINNKADEHDTWTIIDASEDGEDGEGEGEGEGEDGEGGSPGEGEGEGGNSKTIVIGGKKGKNCKPINEADIPDAVKEKIKEIMDKKKNKGNGSQPNALKQRGVGSGGNEHQGFGDNLYQASARDEVKQTIKESIRKAGFNPDSPEDIENALNDIPYLKVFGHIVKEWLNIKKKNWKRELCQELTHCLNATEQDYTMSREHRAIDDTFPGKRRELGIDLILGVDTSGSINYQDWNDFIGQIQKISRDCDIDRARIIQCHHRISEDKVHNIRNAKNIAIREVGGTTMRLVFEKLKREKNKKLLILFTDGFIDDFTKLDYPGFRSIMFLSRGGVENRKQLEEKGFKVICQEDE